MSPSGDQIMLGYGLNLNVQVSKLGNRAMFAIFNFLQL